MEIDKLNELIVETENEIQEEFRKIEKIEEINSRKVLQAFQKNRVSEVHFNSTTGYGYGDIGRECIEKIYADVFECEDSLVRSQFISGTHALTVTLFALLRPGDTLLSINGKPYDTLDKVIGIEENASSLKSFGINYDQIDLVNNEFDIPAIQARLRKSKIKLIEIQRSVGYSDRNSITIEQVEEVINKIREVDNEVIIMVDNCYCEMVGTKEPTQVGADVVIGSLIKNLGGGLASNGAYVVGKKELIERVAERLTVPGQGKEVGPTLGMNKQILQGLFMAPSVVASSIKTAIFASRLLEKLGYNVKPKYNDIRSDIVQTISFGNADKLIKFCQGIQMGSPIDSVSIPEPWDMPGYTNKVVMAAGAFTSGSSIELSCDAPIREPYIAYLQGGLTYQYGKLGVIKAVENLEEV